MNIFNSPHTFPQAIRHCDKKKTPNLLRSKPFAAPVVRIVRPPCAQLPEQTATRRLYEKRFFFTRVCVRNFALFFWQQG